MQDKTSSSKLSQCNKSQALEHGHSWDNQETNEKLPNSHQIITTALDKPSENWGKCIKMEPGPKEQFEIVLMEIPFQKPILPRRDDLL